LGRKIPQLRELVREWLELFPQAPGPGRHWLKVLSQVQAHAAEDLCRVAVVGAVKSGKSTAINALVGRDLLRRGAGILTAMITRVHSGEPEAVLRFKDWGEINGEINRALGLLPSSRLKERAAPFDLQRDEDRNLLGQILAEAMAEEIWEEGSLDPNYLLLRSYLEGYNLVGEIMAGPGTLALKGPDLARHGELVTREATAVFLKDVLLTVPFPWEAAGLELGDCQGSDSPIPQHMAQVLAYLVKSDLVLYVVSSRVGLRQADFQFLGELKRMGLLPHIFFLLNLDLGELGSLAEAARLRDRMVRELAMWQPELRVCAFSALKLLLEGRRTRGEALDPREAALLSVWEIVPEVAAYSDKEASRFMEEFQAAVRELRTRRLAGGSLAQVVMAARGLKEQAELAQDLLGRDLGAIKGMQQRLEARQQPLKATLDSLHRALEGAAGPLKKVLKDRVTSLMDTHGGQVGGGIAGFIRNYEPEWDRLAPPEAGTAQFRSALYQMFQDLVKALDRLVSAEINVTVVEFVQAQEEWLRRELTRVEEPLLLSLQESLTLYYREMADLGLPAAPPALEPVRPLRPPDMDLPLLNLQLEPGWWLAGEVWVLSGVGLLGRTWEALKLRLKMAAETEPRRRVLKGLNRALKTIKKWLEEQVRMQLVDFGERLKFRFFFPLVDRWVKDQEAALDDALASLLADLEGMAAAVQVEEKDRAARGLRLEELISAVRKIEEQLVASSRLSVVKTENQELGTGNRQL
jgi:hypothetical protein